MAPIGLGLGLGIGRAGGALPSLAALFAGGEEGLLKPDFDPARGYGDMSRLLYQDADGQTPATAADDPVALILDESKGLRKGAEAVDNNSFDGGATGWTAGGNATLSVTGGVMRVTRADASSYPRAYQSVAVVNGAWYLQTATVTAYSGAGEAFAGGWGGAARSSIQGMPGTISRIVKATASTHNFEFGIYSSSGGAGDWVEFSDVSLRRLPGNHLAQSTSGARPLLKSSGGLWDLLFDGVDDRIAVAFASALPQPFTLAMAHRLVTVPGSGSPVWIDSTTLANRCYFLNTTGGSADVLVYGGGTARSVATAPDTDPHVWRARFDGAASLVARDGQDLALSGALGTNAWAGVNLGSSYAAGLFTNQRLAGLVVVGRAIAAGEQRVVDRLLGASAGLSL